MLNFCHDYFDLEFFVLVNFHAIGIISHYCSNFLKIVFLIIDIYIVEHYFDNWEILGKYLWKISFHLILNVSRLANRVRIMS